MNFKGTYDATLSGQTCAGLAMQGFRLWASTYTGSYYDFEPGMAFAVQVNIHDIYIKVSVHEFGHVLGLGDLYVKGLASTQECPGGKHFVAGASWVLTAR